MSIPVGHLNYPISLENGLLSKNSGSNPLTFSGFGEDHLGTPESLAPWKSEKYYVCFFCVKLSLFRKKWVKSGDLSVFEGVTLCPGKDLSPPTASEVISPVLFWESSDMT